MSQHAPRLCQIFREIRGTKTLRAFAKELRQRGCNVSYSYLCKIEKGERSPSIKVLWKVSQFFNYPIKELLKAKQNLNVIIQENKNPR